MTVTKYIIDTMDALLYTRLNSGHKIVSFTLGMHCCIQEVTRCAVDSMHVLLYTGLHGRSQDTA